MPESFFQLSRQNQANALAAVSDFFGRAPHLLEKDICVVWALATLFRSDLGAHLVFKGGTALSKAHKVITRFSEDVDLTYDIRALAPELVRGAPVGIDAIPPTRSQEKKWSDEISLELLPAWIRNQAHPVIQAGLDRLEKVSSRIKVGHPPGSCSGLLFHLPPSPRSPSASDRGHPILRKTPFETRATRHVMAPINPKPGGPS